MAIQILNKKFAMISIHGKKEKVKKVPYELIDRWHNIIFSNMGISSDTDIKTTKEALRKIILETSKFYDNLIRLEEGLKTRND